MKLYSFKIIGLVIASLVLITSFQNCSQNGFQLEQASLKDPTSLNAVIQPVCSNGATEVGYLTSSALYPALCGTSFTKTCVNGQWNSTVSLSPTCKQLCVNSLTNQPAESGSTFASYVNAQGATQAACDANTNKIVSVCDSNTGTFLPKLTANISCMVQGQTCAYSTGAGLATPNGNMTNSTVTGFAASVAVGPNLCGQMVTRTCQASGQWTGSVPLYTGCVQKCAHPDNSQPVDINTAYTYYSISSGSQAQCDAARKTSTCQSTTGLFSPVVASGTRFASCSVIMAPAITKFDATPTTVTIGQVTDLSWTVAGATTLIINPGNINVTGKLNHSISPTASTTYTLSATNASGTTTRSVTVTVSELLLGSALYANRCASCHAAFEISSLKAKTVTSALITNAISTIGAMQSININQQQIDSIVTLFSGSSGGGTTPVVTSQFACNTAQQSKSSSVKSRRLSANELINTYSSILPAAVYTAVAGSINLLPTISQFSAASPFAENYSESNVDRISEFNELVAKAVVANDTNVKAFFGTCASLTTFPQTCFNTFMRSLAPRILRYVPTATTNTAYWNSLSAVTAVKDKLSVLTQILLNSPRFLYLVEEGEGAASADGFYALTSYEVASRVSYGMTARPPDATLLAAAQSNSLKTLANVTAQVDRISRLDSFKTQVLDFAKYYVGRSIAADPVSNADFVSGLNTTNIATAAKADFDQYINHIVFSTNGTLSDLFSSRAAFPTTAGLASVYGTAVWTQGATPMTAANHSGLLSKPFLNIAGSLNNRMVQRGRTIRMNMLCYDVPQPSAADLSARPELTEADLVNLNRRSYIDKSTLVASNCIACHSKMNQLGFSTGNYDALGRFIRTEKIYNASGVKVSEHPVVTSVKPEITSDDARTFIDLNDFSTNFVQSNAMQQCMSMKVFQFFQWKKEDVATDSCRLNKMDNLIKNKAPLIQVFMENFKQESILSKRSQ